jgi:acetolactate synthase-1/2/3 large subunit
VVELSAVSNRHYMHQASLSFIGDIAAAVGRLGSGVPVAEAWPDGEPEAVRGRLRELFAAGGEEWGARAVIEVARERLPRETVATVDSGAHRILLSQMWQCHAPRTLLQSTGLCTMGCALPLAIGYKRAAPQTPVAAFIGDGCLEMVLGELATLRDCGRPVLLFVFVDRSLALIELKQRASGHDNVGVDFPGTDFAAVATAMGGRGVACRSREQLAREVDAALARDTFTLLACEIGPRAYDGAF